MTFLMQNSINLKLQSAVGYNKNITFTKRVCTHTCTLTVV